MLHFLYLLEPKRMRVLFEYFQTSDLVRKALLGDVLIKIFGGVFIFSFMVYIVFCCDSLSNDKGPLYEIIVLFLMLTMVLSLGFLALVVVEMPCLIGIGCGA